MTLEGGCLCSRVRYAVEGPPDWVTICYCRFCQRATGAQGMIEPIFPVTAFRITAGAPARYVHVSGGSGKEVYVHFCADCGTKTHLTFERWDDRLGIYSGTLDDPDQIAITPENCKHIFLETAREGTLIPAGVKTYEAHAATPEGAPLGAQVFAEVHAIRR